MSIALSILVPAVPSRISHLLVPLLHKLTGQIERRQYKDLEVELLVLCDNKQRSVGAKRNALLDLAQGKYLAFVDDDDDVSVDYVDQLLAATEHNCDVIVFDQRVFLNEEWPPRVVHFGLQFTNEDIAAPGGEAKRKPFHCCAWRSTIAKQGRFSDKQWGEDWYWVQQVLPLAVSQHRIAAVLHTYRWSAASTEAFMPGTEIADGKRL